MENKRLDCLAACRKKLLTEKGARKHQLGKAVKYLEKSKRFVMATIDPITELEMGGDIPANLMLPFPSVSIEVIDAGNNPIYGATAAMVTLVRQISDKEVSVYIFAKFDGGLGWKHAYIDLRVIVNEKGLLDIGYSHRVNIDPDSLPPEAIKQIDLLCDVATVQVLSFINFLTKYPEQVEYRQPVREKAHGKPGKPLKIDSYHALVIPTVKSIQQVSYGGTHNSPRAHERRGFWRTSKYGIRHWVNATIVNPEAENVIVKDYVIPSTVH